MSQAALGDQKLVVGFLYVGSVRCSWRCSLGLSNTLIRARDPHRLMDLEERRDRLNQGYVNGSLILGKERHCEPLECPTQRECRVLAAKTLDRYHLAQKIAVMQVYESSAELGKVIGLYAEPMLSRLFY